MGIISQKTGGFLDPMDILKTATDGVDLDREHFSCDVDFDYKAGFAGTWTKDGRSITITYTGSGEPTVAEFK